MTKKKEITILISLVVLLVILNYNFLDSKVESFFLGDQSEKTVVERIIDGDTIVTEIGNVRLLGINTPERGERGFLEAKVFLENLILNKSVVLEYVGPREDKYGRILAYVFLEGGNINLKLVENGFGNYYFYDGRDIYSEDLEEAWNSCISKEINLCGPSDHECSKCISIEGEKIVNQCGFSCNIEAWEVKEEGRDKFVFEGSLEPNGKREFELEQDNKDGLVFLRDGEGGLVVYV